MSNADLDKFLGECPAHKKLPWKIGAMESGQVAIDSDDGKEVTGWIDPEDAFLILNQQQCIEELERERDAFYMGYRMKCDEEAKDSALVIIERDQLREQVTMLRDALLTCSVGDFSTGYVIHPSFDENLVEEALAATEPK